MGELVQRNPCFGDDVSGIVSRVCPVTCGLCNETKTNATSGGAVTSVCRDYDNECSVLQNACGALEPVDKLCPLTCGVCKGPLKCRVCSDPLCDDFESVQQCPEDAPYCFSTVVNDDDGKKHITKRCGGELDCNTLWLANSAVEPKCQYYDINTVYDESFTCNYCCVENNCNSRLVPLPDAQYRKKP